MDIRNFFGPKAGKTKKKPLKHDDDDDDDFVSKSSKAKKKKKVKGLIFDSDSSDEDPLPKKVKKRLKSDDIIPTSDAETPGKMKKSMAKTGNKVKARKNEEKPKFKEISPDSFFASSSTSVKKEKRLSKRKASDEPEPEPNEVITIDDDIDFDGSLSTGMTPKKKVKRERSLEQKSNKTLSSKVADMVKKREGNAAEVSDNIKADKKKVKSAPKVQDDATEKPSKTQSKVPEGSLLASSIGLSGKSSSAQSTSTKAVPVQNVENVNKQKISPLKEKKSNTPRKVTPEKPKTDNATPEGSAKQERYMKYMQWQNRSGPKAPGSKEIPQGADNCLEGLTFVITGTLESLERDEAKSLIERYGGKVTGSVSGRTSYLIIGDDAGESKIKKAEQHKTKQIDEDGLLELIKTKPGKKSKYEIQAEKETGKSIKAQKKIKKSPTAIKSESKISDMSVKPDVHEKPQSSSSFYGKKKNGKPVKTMSSGAGDSCKPISPLSDSQKVIASSAEDAEFMLWVDKYKPKTLKQIIGQQGAKSNVEKLKSWLLDWHKNNRPQDGSKPKPKPKVNMWGGGGDPTGAGFKAALLSGPPGVGKTTAATLVCQELGFQFIELNASDTRSKRTLKDEVSHMLDNSSISSMFGTEEQKKTAADGTKNALIMDEIDGMAGNEDRGGMQEVILLIKTTKIPIICMCNDRSSPKIRSLTNHCFDLRFQRPRVEQITGAMMSICFKEGLKIPAPALQALIRGCNQDVRQILYNLSMLKASNKTVSYDEAKKHADDSQKDVSLGIFDVARKLLTSESASLSINEKLSLFFMDYSMMPLFVQDNYPHIRTASAAGNIHKQLSSISKSADSIAIGDRIDKLIRSDQAWSALPTLGLLSTVLPCDIMRGGMSGMINFPSFFGKLSTTGKNRRLLQELKFHSSLTTDGANVETFNTDYIPYLRWHLTHPLIDQSKTGELKVQQTTGLLDAYSLLREDFDSIVDIGQYPGKPQPLSMVDSKVKSAFTRTFNKEVHKTPYAVQAVGKKSKKPAAPEDLGFGMEGESQTSVLESEEEDNGEMDGMIKAKKPSKRKGSSSVATKSSKSEKGRRGKKK